MIYEKPVFAKGNLLHPVYLLCYFFLFMDIEIDWEEQWAHHAPNFIEGLARILLPNGNTVFLKPGPGFGDYSHPTTRLMIGLMAPHVGEKEVFDIGCGSGILSIAAAKMGAKKISCVDIDPQALLHTDQNAKLNNVFLSPSLSSQPVILMNMIASEQKVAWEKQQSSFDTLITSGILEEERDLYLRFATSQGWVPFDEEQSEGWLGFVFKENR